MKRRICSSLVKESSVRLTTTSPEERRSGLVSPQEDAVSPTEGRINDSAGIDDEIDPRFGALIARLSWAGRSK
jgi:hypothetical protein